MNTLARLSRRAFVTSAAAAGLAGASGLAMPFYSRASSRPAFTHGVQSGDVEASSGMIWTRTDRPARVMFEVSTTESFANSTRLAPLDTSPASDFTVKRLLADLASDQDIFYRMVAADLADINTLSEPIVGRFKTAPASKRSIRFAWSGDTAGQGWGIDETGMKTYATMAEAYAGFLPALGRHRLCRRPDEGRGRPSRRNQMEEQGADRRKTQGRRDARRISRPVEIQHDGPKHSGVECHLPDLLQWDDHEVTNNWSSAKNLAADERYTEKSIALLAGRAAQAFHEMTPIRFAPEEPGRVYRKIAYGPMLDVFFLDMRSYRGANGTLNARPR